MSSSCEQPNTTLFPSPAGMHDTSLLHLLSQSLKNSHKATSSPVRQMIALHTCFSDPKPSRQSRLINLTAIVQSAIDLVDEEDFSLSRTSAAQPAGWEGDSDFEDERCTGRQ